MRLWHPGRSRTALRDGGIDPPYGGSASRHPGKYTGFIEHGVAVAGRLEPGHEMPLDPPPTTELVDVHLAPGELLKVVCGPADGV